MFSLVQLGGMAWNGIFIVVVVVFPGLLVGPVGEVLALCGYPYKYKQDYVKVHFATKFTANPFYYPKRS
jgi:hypothetical protein